MCWFLVFGALQALLHISEAVPLKSSPVIAVLAQPRYKDIKSLDYDHLYIAASYVKWLEAGGARSIAIPYDATSTSYLDSLFEQVDAILLPGGTTRDFSFALTYLLDRAVKENREGRYFPVWGTCLGMEFLVKYFSETPDSILQGGYQSENVSLALEDALPVGLYKNAAIYDIVTMHNVTLNNHEFGLHPADFWKSPALQEMWLISAMGHDTTGRPFVASLEPRSFAMPFYGVQYHPEKNAFEYATFPDTSIPYEAISHTEEAVDFSLFSARFFVNLARKTQGHTHTKVGQFPYLFMYPQKVGLDFELVHLVPKASSGEMPSLRLSKNVSSA